jgi:hypothetical protein
MVNHAPIFVECLFSMTAYYQRPSRKAQRETARRREYVRRLTLIEEEAKAAAEEAETERREAAAREKREVGTWIVLATSTRAIRTPFVLKSWHSVTWRSMSAPCSVIQPVLNLRLLSYMASYDVASIVHQSLP